MTAPVSLRWQSFKFPAQGVASWGALKKQRGFSDHPGLLSPRAVYVIRVCRPFSFAYDDKHSPVAYIGKGNAKQRLTSHITSWIPELVRKIPDLKIEIFYCEPRMRWHGTICEGVEADLIQRFIELYGDRPLRNKNTPTHPYNWIYTKEALRVLNPGQGVGYHWALTPLRSSQFYK